MEKKTKAIIDPNKPNLDFDGDDPIPRLTLENEIQPEPGSMLAEHVAKHGGKVYKHSGKPKEESK